MNIKHSHFWASFVMSLTANLKPHSFTQSGNRLSLCDQTGSNILHFAYHLQPHKVGSHQGNIRLEEICMLFSEWGVSFLHKRVKGISLNPYKSWTEWKSEFYQEQTQRNVGDSVEMIEKTKVFGFNTINKNTIKIINTQIKMKIKNTQNSKLKRVNRKKS